MMRQLIIPSLIFLLALTFAVSSVSASPSTPSAVPSNEPALAPGNYCVSCHLADDPRLATVTEWKGGIGREINSACPAATKIHEELYYTERLLLMIDRARQEAGSLPEKQQIQLEKYTQQYSRLLDQPVTSLDAFVAEAQTTRYRLNKIYAGLNDNLETAKKRTVLIYAGIASLIVLGSLAWGLYNAHNFKSGYAQKPRRLIGPAAFVLVVLVFFALPIFRIPAAEVAEVTAEQQEAQTILDSADRAAAAADRAQARAWMLARLGALWNESDPAQAQTAMEKAFAAVQQARENEKALWGQSLAVQEAMIGIPIDMEKAGLVAVDVNAARARAWSIPLIAIEWNKLDPVRAAELLRGEQNALGAQTGDYRDLQLRLAALAWAQVEPSKAIPTAQTIEDPSIRAWTLRELGAFDLAAEAARQVEEPVQRARALREVGVASQEESLFEEALVALNGVPDAPLAYALSDLAAASGDVSIIVKIPQSYDDAYIAGLLRLGNYPTAQRTVPGIIDPYERARAQAAIASAWKEEFVLKEIDVPLYRDLAMRDIVRATGDPALAHSIQSGYYRVQAWTAAGDYENAIEVANELADSYPLIELVSVLATEDPQAALALVDKMGREADKAVALRIIAATTNDEAFFEQAQGMALAARVRGDSLAPAQASLDLANALWTVSPVHAEAALRQAYETALRISTK
jgi:hypothetical protein